MDASGWTRGAFCMSPEELDLHEAALALRRVLDGSKLNREARHALEVALAVIESRAR
jgi:hypothetical protein